MAKRDLFVTVVKQNIGLPYIYGGQGPRGCDCSGFIIYCARLAGISMPDMTAKEMLETHFHDFKKLPAAAQPGDLLFYGDTALRISHVMVVINRWKNGALVVAGARGGNALTTNEDIARKQGAFIDVNIDYWPKNVQMAVDPFRKWEN
jgi:cell wall-associated NlpC family hydrolase